MIKILLIDDHTLFRTGMKLLLGRQADFDVVGEAPDAVEGIKRLHELKPDLVLLDLHMPGLSGLEALQLILEMPEPPQVLMLTVSEDAEDLGAALRAGASGYLLKNIDADELTGAIRRAHAGEAVVSRAMTAKLVQQLRAAPLVAAPAEKDKLTPREREILTLIAKGDSNKLIARQLDVAESTVKIHVQSILKKLNLASRVQAAVYAVEHGIVTE